MAILITGASGFVGRALCKEAYKRGRGVRPVLRSLESARCIDNLSSCACLVPSLDGGTDWGEALAGIDVVVHCAAKAHTVNNEIPNSTLDAFREINVFGTLNLAQQAAKQGVNRFVFISSIGVNGAETDDLPFTVQDVPAPHSPYAVSKYEAEIGLKALAAKTGMEVVIIRPPLVYGPNAPGNFGSLMCWLERGIPLPLGAICNKRSFVGLDNLVDLILRCVSHPDAANQTFLVSDGEDVSTSELLRRMSSAMDRPSRLIPVPAILLRISAGLFGKSGMAQSLCGSLQVDISKTLRILDWSPPISLDEGLRKAVRKKK